MFTNKALSNLRGGEALANNMYVKETQPKSYI